jgi:hypothetical protein
VHRCCSAVELGPLPHVEEVADLALLVALAARVAVVSVRQRATAGVITA